MEYLYSDKLQPAGRRPRLYLARGSQAVRFAGENIPGYCVVLTARYEKSGKWSNTGYRLHLLPGTRPVELLSPLHGTWGDSLASWGEVANRLGLPVEAAKAVVIAEYPTTARRLDAIEEAMLASEDGGSSSSELVVVSFGSPTNRQIAGGWWELPKSAETADGRLVTVTAGPDNDWSCPVIVAPDGATVVASVHSPGMHGGYWAIEVVVP